MQLTAYHDSEGNIVGLVVSPPDSVPVEVKTEAHPGGLRRTEIEVPTEVTLDLDSPQQLAEDMEKVRKNYLVEVPPSAKGKLKGKPAPAAEQS
jgi:hypothetical protein